MTTFLNILPGTIEQTESGGYRIIYAGDLNIHNMLPDGMVYIVVYSPNDHLGAWHSILYEVLSSSREEPTSLKVIKQRFLERSEITHFEALIADRGE